MIFGITVLCLIPILAAVLYFILTRPNHGRREAVSSFARIPFAHRGLHDRTVPENTVSAFRAAASAGYGIELDVRLTKDGKVVVFHDEDLLRAAGLPVKIAEISYEELKAVRIFGSEERIPLFSEAAAEANGVPLLVEIKDTPRLSELCEKTAAVLSSYNGSFAVQSFHPGAPAWFKKHHPEVLRGQLSSDFRGESLSSVKKFLLSNMLLNVWSKPDFTAYDIRACRRVLFRLYCRIHRPVLFCWVVRSREDVESAEKRFEGIIFEEIRL